MSLPALSRLVVFGHTSRGSHRYLPETDSAVVGRDSSVNQDPEARVRESPPRSLGQQSILKAAPR